MNGDIEEYTRRYNEVLKPIAANLEQFISGHLEGVPNIDRVSARAKSPDRFADKARKTEGDRPKYQRPLTEIQDQVGGRIIVFYRDDVETVARIVNRYFTAIEDRELVPDSQWEFGYFGQHYILSLPRDVIPEGARDQDVPRFFELQIKTLFQHAWSEANHDLGYKARRALTADHQRRLAYTAAQAWGADRAFSELFRELCL